MRWLALAFLLTSCSPSCQREADAFWHQRYKCGNLDVKRYTDDVRRVRVVCDGDELLDVTCTGLRVEWERGRA